MASSQAGSGCWRSGDLPIRRLLRLGSRVAFDPLYWENVAGRWRQRPIFDSVEDAPRRGARHLPGGVLDGGESD